MRKPTEDELRLFQRDIIAFEKYCSDKSLITDRFKERYDGVKVRIGEIEGTQGVAGKTERKEKTIIIRPDKMQDDKERRHVLFHEIGHLLFGVNSENKDENRELIQRMFQIIKSNRDILNKDVKLYSFGIKLLEEYIVEKFSTNASHTTLNKNIQMNRNCKHVVSGDYVYNTTFPGGYGLFESLCDELLGKAYGNFDDILLSCQESTFYKDLFDKYDEVELMKILGEFGYVYESLMMFAKDRTIRSVPQTQEALENLSEMIPKIKLKTIHRTNSNRVTPESIAQVTCQCIQENSGIVSERVRRSEELFTRIFNRNRESQNR